MRRLMLFFLFLMLCLPAWAARAQQETPTATPSAAVTPTRPVGGAAAAATDSAATLTAIAALTATATPSATPLVLLQSPSPGQALQGSVTITGSSAVPGFTGGQVFFTYSGDTTGTWFLIGTITQTISAGALAQWDTTTISDGEYDLRLALALQDGGQMNYTVKGLRVRNYSPIETSTPTPVTPTATSLPGDTPVPSATPTATHTPLPPTPTGLPPNPAEIGASQMRASALNGALALAGCFALAGVYLLVKKLRYRN